jgi:serine/threonine protein kinase
MTLTKSIQTPLFFLYLFISTLCLFQRTLTLNGKCSNGAEFKKIIEGGKTTLKKEIKTMCYAIDTANLEKLFPGVKDSFIVGEGGFGTVYQYTNQDSLLFTSEHYKGDSSIAVKITKDVTYQEVYLELNNSKCLSEFPDFWEKETSNLVIINYCYYDGTKKQKEYYLTLKYYPYTLDDFINETAPVTNYNHQMKLIMIVLCIQLQKMHDHNLLHRDIKPTNVVLSEKLIPHFIDFGTMSLELETATSFVGTYTYMSPEVAKENAYGRQADLFSLGLVFHNLISKTTSSHFDMLKAASAPTHFKNESFENYNLNPALLKWPKDLKFLSKLLKPVANPKKILTDIISKLQEIVVKEHAMLEMVTKKDPSQMTKEEKMMELSARTIPPSMRNKSRLNGMNRNKSFMSTKNLTPTFMLL